MLSEIWCDIAGYEIYQVSSHGRVRAIDHVDSIGRNRRAKLRALVPDKQGYLTCKLNNPEKTCKVHRLVAEAFIPNGDAKPQVNHKDLNPANNRASNLEWVTPQENTDHYWRSR